MSFNNINFNDNPNNILIIVLIRNFDNNKNLLSWTNSQFDNKKTNHFNNRYDLIYLFSLTNIILCYI